VLWVAMVLRKVTTKGHGWPEEDTGDAVGDEDGGIDISCGVEG